MKLDCGNDVLLRRRRHFGLWRHSGNLFCACARRIMLILISNMADVLDEQEEVLQDMECTDMDYRKMRQSQEAAGYREGMESGKEASLQQGFNDGFIYGASVSREWAKLRGVLSALMLFVSSNSVQVLHPNITNEITELLALVCQMENKALSTQNMKDVIQDQINPQDQCSLEKSENGGASLTHHKVVTKGRTVNEHELLVAFEMLDTQDGSTNGIDDLRSRCEQSENVVGKRCSKDPALPEKFFNCSQTPVETFKIKCNDMEHLWTMIVSLADRLGINEQKILAVKNI